MKVNVKKSIKNSCMFSFSFSFSFLSFMRKNKKKKSLAKRLALELDPAPKEKKKKKKKQDKPTAPAESAVEATKQMLTQKKFSKKINYEVLEGLFDIHEDLVEKKDLTPQASQNHIDSLFSGVVVKSIKREEKPKEVPKVPEDPEEEHPDDYFDEEELEEKPVFFFFFVL